MKEKILTEIARLKERYVVFHRRDGIDWPLDNYGKMRAYNEIEEFINSLPEEDVIEGVISGNAYFKQKSIDLPMLPLDIYDKIGDFGDKVKVVIVRED